MQLFPERRVTEILEKFSGVEMSPATVATICRRKVQEHYQIAEAWERQVAQGKATKSRDKMGVRVEVQTQRLQVMSTEKSPSLRIAKSRSNMCDGLAGRVRHDHVASYSKRKICPTDTARLISFGSCGLSRNNRRSGRKRCRGIYWYWNDSSVARNVVIRCFKIEDRLR